MKQANIFELLDYVGAKYGEHAVKDIVLAVATVDGESSPEEVIPDEHDSVPEIESALSTTNEPKGIRLVTADVKSIRALLDAGKPAILRREADGFEACVLRIDGNTIYLDRDVSDGKGKSSNHRSRHIIARTWRLVL